MPWRMSTAPSPDRVARSLHLAIVLLGLVPAFMVLLPWDFGSDMNPYRGFMRGTSLAVTIIQLPIAAIAFYGKFKLIPAIIDLPASTKIGLGLIWAIFLLSTFTVAANQAFALLGMLQLAVHLLFVLSLSYMVSGAYDVSHRQIWLAVGWSVVGYALLWLANIAFYHPQGDDWVWFVPALTNIRWIGFFALAGFCSGLGTLVLTAEGGINRRKIMLPLLFCAIGCFLAMYTASRGAIVAIIIAASFAAYAANDRTPVAATVLLTFLVAIAATAALPTPHPIYGLERIFGSAMQSGNIDALSSGRIHTWAATVEKITVRPWFGWGIDQFRFSGPEATLGFRHPHQSILQLLFATGIAGAGAIMMIAAPLLRRFPKVFLSPAQSAAGSYLVAGTVYGLYDGFFYYAYPVMVYLVAMAILVKPLPSQVATGKSD